jgi:hypothetical protein
MANFTLGFLGLLFAIFLGWGFYMLAPAKIRRLEQARLAFCGAAICLVLFTVVGIADVAPNGLILVVTSAICGAIIGVLILAMWLGVDHEISQIDDKAEGK